MKRSGMALVRLMEEDGLEIPASPDPIRRMACFRTEHQYFSPLWINVVEGTFSCKVCGFGGDAYTYLAEIRKIHSVRVRRRMLEGFSWRHDRISRSEFQYYQRKRAEKGLPPLRQEAAADTNRPWPETARYEYRTLKGRLTNVILVFSENPARPSTRTYEREFTPAHTALTDDTPPGMWLSDPINMALPDEDRVAKRPLYRLPFREGKAVWVVESEHAANALAEMAPDIDFTTVCRNIPAAKLYDYDLTPFKGHDVWCVASQLSTSKTMMKVLSERLRKELKCRTALVLPPGRGKVGLNQIIPAQWPAVQDWVYARVAKSNIK